MAGLPSKVTHCGHVYIGDFIADVCPAGLHGCDGPPLNVIDAGETGYWVAWRTGELPLRRRRLGICRQELQTWLKAAKIGITHIESAIDGGTAFGESFQGRFCDECLNPQQLWTLA